MPTGYTSYIYDGGKDFTKFAINCARAFGALVNMRDEPNDAQIPEEIVSDSYHTLALAKAKKELKKLEKLSVYEASIKASKEHESIIKEAKKQIALIESRKKRYEYMLKKAEEYVSPSPEHDTYKEFMIQQIKSSLEFDCDNSFYVSDLRNKKLTGKEWLKNNISLYKGTIKYHEVCVVKENENAKKKTAWLKNLRISLGI
jgi:hypothetical protein